MSTASEMTASKKVYKHKTTCICGGMYYDNVNMTLLTQKTMCCNDESIGMLNVFWEFVLEFDSHSYVLE